MCTSRRSDASSARTPTSPHPKSSHCHASDTGSTPRDRTPRETKAMRRRIVWSIVGVSVVALLVLGIPLGIAVGRLYENEAVLRLEREASEGRRRITVPALTSGPPERLPPDGEIRFALYPHAGVKVRGPGPPHADVPVRRALRDEVHDART